MKKLIFAGCMIVLCALTTKAQNIRLNGYAGYVFDDRVNSTISSNVFYDGTIRGGLRWGAGLEYMVKPDMGIEFMYLRQDTKAPTRFQTSSMIIPQNTEFDVALNWYMLGFNKSFRKPGARVEGFFGGNMGVAYINVDNPDTRNSNSSTKFAWGIKGGAILWATEKVGIKLQSDLMSAVQAFGGGLFFGTGGAAVGISTFSTMLQFGLGGGLTIKLGDNK